MTLRRAGASRQQGQSLVEFIVVLPILMFLIMGIVQFALLYQAKSVLDHAAFLAARSGSLNNGQKGGFNPLGAGINQGMASGLAPLFNHGTTLGALTQARTKAFTEVVDPLITTINVINPTPQMINDFAIPRLDGGPGREIPNDSLQYRDSTAMGATSRVSIQDANLLKLEITYCVKLIVPIANRAIYSISNGIDNFWNPGNDTRGSRSRSCLAFTDRIPLKAYYTMRMESSYRDPR